SLMPLFANPILGMIAGAVLTAVIQSSSASVGILQALCATGAVNFSTALPIIMGQNIGTCITAIMSSIGASKNAKRAAAVHLYFNLIGTILFMCLFYLFNAFFHFSFLNTAANAAGIALVHSVFNISATVVLFPFANQLEKLAILTIPDKKSEKGEQAGASPDFGRLDERFLDKPGLAVEECQIVAIDMAKKAKEAMFLAIELLTKYNKEIAERVLELEDQIDQYEDVIGTYLVKLSSRDLSEKDSRTLSIILHCIGDFERISDHAVNVQEAAEEMQKKKLQFSEKAREELVIFSSAIMEILSITVDVFEKSDLERAREIEPLEQVVDKLNMEEKQRHISRLRQGRCTIELGFILSDISTNYERVADHCSNIGLCIIEVNEGVYGTHGYVNDLKEENYEEFRSEFLEYSEKYTLPPSKHSEVHA
ncbi:MAG: Na/Pi symporter, partial [Clostridiales bacterium]|nr:Na/Pi symporter [Clostridiales bacterium]